MGKAPWEAKRQHRQQNSEAQLLLAAMARHDGFLFCENHCASIQHHFGKNSSLKNPDANPTQTLVYLGHAT